MQHHRVEVEIMGEKYVLKGDVHPEQIRQIAAYVDNQIRSIKNANSRLSMVKATVLATLNITEELFKLQESYNELIKIIEDEK
ncbi:MAG: cell division protein ZapA [Peptococcaceae bacterium]|nr:cell division protein ZapA [Peptococcaceae bacterium]